jgi:hypothetical protein
VNAGPPAPVLVASTPGGSSRGPIGSRDAASAAEQTGTTAPTAGFGLSMGWWGAWEGFVPTTHPRRPSCEDHGSGSPLRRSPGRRADHSGGGIPAITEVSSRSRAARPRHGRRGVLFGGAAESRVVFHAPTRSWPGLRTSPGRRGHDRRPDWRLHRGTVAFWRRCINRCGHVDSIAFVRQLVVSVPESVRVGRLPAPVGWREAHPLLLLRLRPAARERSNQPSGPEPRGSRLRPARASSDTQVGRSGVFVATAPPRVVSRLRTRRPLWVNGTRQPHGLVDGDIRRTGWGSRRLRSAPGLPRGGSRTELRLRTRAWRVPTRIGRSPRRPSPLSRFASVAGARGHPSSRSVHHAGPTDRDGTPRTFGSDASAESLWIEASPNALGAKHRRGPPGPTHAELRGPRHAESSRDRSTAESAWADAPPTTFGSDAPPRAFGLDAR